jgi:hypothetical protein
VPLRRHRVQQEHRPREQMHPLPGPSRTGHEHGVREGLPDLIAHLRQGR